MSSGQVGAWGVAQWPKASWLTFSKPKKSRDEVTLTVLLSSLLGAREFAQALVAQSADVYWGMGPEIDRNPPGHVGEILWFIPVSCERKH